MPPVNTALHVRLGALSEADVRLTSLFVRYDEELYQALASNELHPQNLKKVNMKKAAGS